MRTDSPLAHPASFDPDNTGEQLVVDIEERQKDILEHAGRQFQLPNFGEPEWEGFISKDPFDTNIIVRIGDTSEYEVFSRSVRQTIARETSDIDRNEISRELQDIHEREISFQESFCENAVEIYEEAGLDTLTPEEIVNAKELAERLDHMGEQEKAGKADRLIEEYFERIEDHPLVSERQSSLLDSPINYDEARELLREKDRHLRETSLDVFGELDEDVIEDIKGAYLGLIWDDIQEN